MPRAWAIGPWALPVVAARFYPRRHLPICPHAYAWRFRFDVWHGRIRVCRRGLISLARGRRFRRAFPVWEGCFLSMHRPGYRAMPERHLGRRGLHVSRVNCLHGRVVVYVASPRSG
jgi:hypothetical protein